MKRTFNRHAERAEVVRSAGSVVAAIICQIERREDSSHCSFDRRSATGSGNVRNLNK